MKKILLFMLLLFILFGCANPIEETVRDSLPMLFEEAELSSDTEMIHLGSQGNRRAFAVFSEPHSHQSSYHVALIERVAPDWKLVEIIDVSNEPLNAGVQLNYLEAGIATEEFTIEATYLPLPEEGRYLWYTYNQSSFPIMNANQ